MTTRRPSEYYRRCREKTVRRQGTFASRKQERATYYFRFVHGWRLVKCVACNGSGYYDDTGSPRCSSCEGTGKERLSPGDYQQRKDAGLI